MMENDMTNEEAIKELRHISDDMRGNWKKAINMAIKALEKEQRWIPVSEKLPENDKDVLVCHSNGEMEVCYYHTVLPEDSPYYDTLYKTGWYDEYGDALNPGEPMAWMSLPEPYKTEREDTDE